MTYSFTEKKRIRKSFAKRAAVLDVPFLLATQINSYAEFLQAEAPADNRNMVGLQSAFTSVFPISSHSGNARLEFVSYAPGRPPVRRGRVPAARPHLRLPAARQGAPHDHGPRGLQADGEGSEGAGGVHGRDPAHDPQRLLRHQRHRARDRLAAAPLPGRVLRARPRQDALLRASCSSRRGSSPTAAPGSTSSSTPRTTSTSASTGAARCRSRSC